MNLKRITGFIICFCIIMGVALSVPISASAATATRGYVDATNVNIRSGPSTSTASLGKVSNVYVTIHGKTKGTSSGDTHMWYHITTSSGITGYIRDDLIVEIPDPEPDANFEESLKAFPSSYHKALRDLHALYPNWVFTADKLSMDFNSAVKAEAGLAGNEPLKLVNLASDGISWRSMAKGVYNWNSGTWNSFAGGWTGAAKQVIAYYMDPRNFLNANDIYMFMQQSYDPANQTEAGVQNIIKGTFLEKGYSDSADTAYGGSYVKVIMEAARQSGVSPYVLASTIILEQGVNGTSQLISGTTSYGKYYNFFNFKASGNDVVGNGLTFAKEQGWSTRSASIIGGAKRYGGDYISKGQDTYFYKDFNLGVSSVYSAYTHQYAQSVYDARSSAKRMYNAYNADKASVLNFRIPVYSFIPDTLASKPIENSRLNNHYLTSLKAVGLNGVFDMYATGFTLNISGDTAVYVGLPAGASLSGRTAFKLNAGKSEMEILVRAQTGYTNSYKLTVNAAKSAIVTITDKVLKNDINGDYKFDVKDLIRLKQHFVNPKTPIIGNAAPSGSESAITANDLVMVRRAILGI